MLGKAFSIALIILGLYILVNFILNLGSEQTSNSSGSYYHIGCYEADNSLNESLRISQYLANLTDYLAPFSAEEVRKAQDYSSLVSVKPGRANAVALQFKKYIIALQNIKNHDLYQQSYNLGIREARQDFLLCKQNFLAEPWGCRQTYARYLQSDENFNRIKSNLSRLVSLKFQEQQKVEKLLRPVDEQSSSNDTYHKLIEELNKQLSNQWNIIKIQNQSLINLEGKQFRVLHELSSAQNQLQQCEKNKIQISICQRITEEIKKIDYGLVPEEIMKRINAKRNIIQKYEDALAQTIKVGMDATSIRIKISQNQVELNALEQLYAEAEKHARCSMEIVFKCSDQQILQLQKNITISQASLNNSAILKEALKKDIEEALAKIEDLNNQKKKATQDYQNSIGSLDKIRQLEAANLLKLKELRDNINDYNRQITGMQNSFHEADGLRKACILELSAVDKRVKDLIGCLTKKDYLLKLQSKRPKKSNEDVERKRKAAETLVRVIGESYQ